MKSCLPLRTLPMALAIIGSLVACTSVPTPPTVPTPPIEDTPTGSPAHPSVEFRTVDSENASPGSATITMPYEGRPVLVQNRAFITAADIQSIQMGFDDAMRPIILIQFEPSSQKRIRDFTQGWLNRPVAVLAHGQVLSVATIRTPFSDTMALPGLSGVKNTKERFKLLTTEHADADQ